MTGAVDWTAALNQAVARFKGKVTTSLTRAWTFKDRDGSQRSFRRPRLYHHRNLRS